MRISHQFQSEYIITKIHVAINMLDELLKLNNIRDIITKRQFKIIFARFYRAASRNEPLQRWTIINRKPFLVQRTRSSELRHSPNL